MKVELIRVTSSLARMYAALKFVISARATESTRYAINGVHVEPTCIVATDGRRLHIAYIKNDYEAGQYSVIKNDREIVLAKDESASPFPKFQDIIPDHENYFQSLCLEHTTERVIGFLGEQGISVCLKYLGILNLDLDWEVSYGKPEEPVRFMTEPANEIRYEAIIMPVALNIKEIEVGKLNKKPSKK